MKKYRLVTINKETGERRLVSAVFRTKKSTLEFARKWCSMGGKYDMEVLEEVNGQRKVIA